MPRTPTDPRAAVDLISIVRSHESTPAWLAKRIALLHVPMSREDAGTEAQLVLWDIAKCEELPMWMRQTADGCRRQLLGPTVYLKCKALEIEVMRVCRARR